VGELPRQGDDADRRTVERLLGPWAGGPDAASFQWAREGEDEDEDGGQRRVALVGLGDVLREPDMDRAKSLWSSFYEVDRD
jgi:hypothetical protein